MVGDDKLVLSVGWDGHRIVGVTVASSRRPEVSRVLEGKTPEQVVRMVPMLFSLCGRAQETAAALALEAAEGRVSDSRRARERQVLAEAAMEYVWRILADWPSLIHEEPAMESLAQIRSRLKQAAGQSWQDFSRVLEAFLEQEVLSMSPAEWLGMESVDVWTRDGKTSAARVLGRFLADEGSAGGGNVALMPAPNADELLQEIEPALRNQADFPAQPTWAGETRETGALARMVEAPLVRGLKQQSGSTVALRFLARLVELAEMPLRLMDENPSPSWVGAASPSPGWGLAWVECARGLLLHQVRVEKGRVEHYRIVAPTEWNFHPDGPLVKGLRGVVADSIEAVRERTVAMVQALDPCVAYDIGIYHA